MGTHSALPRAQYRQQPKRMPRTLGFERYALSFDGENDYVDCGNDPSLNCTDAITIEAWVKINTLQAGDVADKKNYYRLNIHSDGKLRPILTLDGTLYSADYGNTALLPGIWYHVALTYDKDGGDNNEKVYINGQIDKQWTKTGAIDLSPETKVTIGSHWDGFSNFFNGTITLARIYKDYALTPEEVKWNLLNYNNPVHPEHLVLWLPMEEGSGLTVYDKSGYGNNGTLLPADDPPTWQRVRQWELRQII